MRRVQLRGGARRPYARRTLGWGSAGAMSGPPQTNNRQCSRPAPNQAWRPRAPHSRRWALILALVLLDGVDHRCVVGVIPPHGGGALEEAARGRRLLQPDAARLGERD